MACIGGADVSIVTIDCIWATAGPSRADIACGALIIVVTCCRIGLEGASEIGVAAIICTRIPIGAGEGFT